MNIGDLVQFQPSSDNDPARVAIIIANSYTSGLNGDNVRTTYPDMRMVLWSKPFENGVHEPVPVETRYLQLIKKDCFPRLSTIDDSKRVSTLKGFYYA